MTRVPFESRKFEGTMAESEFHTKMIAAFAKHEGEQTFKYLTNK